VRRYWQDVTQTQQEVSVVMGRPFVDGDRVAAEFWTTMRNDGADITLPGCLLLRFGQDGLCLARVLAHRAGPTRAPARLG
jgi:hypothetical protein